MNAKTLLCILLAVGAGAAAAAQDEITDIVVEEAPSESAAGLEADAQPVPDPLAKLTETGEHHTHLGRLEGDWDLTIRTWSSPDGEPTEAAGTAEARWILGGRFLWTIYRAKLFGQPFEAWSIEGYDNQAEQYVGTWRDTQGTYTLVYRGKCKREKPDKPDEESDAAAEPDEGSFREMTSKITDPASGEQLDIRNEIRVEDGGFVLETFVVLSPEESLKSLELIGRRRAAS